MSSVDFLLLYFVVVRHPKLIPDLSGGAPLGEKQTFVMSAWKASAVTAMKLKIRNNISPEN
ncbi:MAG: hypothetical protein ABSE05_12235 [Syntrophales bacterium]|jgi:hypothetical protein